MGLAISLSAKQLPTPCSMCCSWLPFCSVSHSPKAPPGLFDAWCIITQSPDSFKEKQTKTLLTNSALTHSPLISFYAPPFNQNTMKEPSYTPLTKISPGFITSAFPTYIEICSFIHFVYLYWIWINVHPGLLIWTLNKMWDGTAWQWKFLAWKGSNVACK